MPIKQTNFSFEQEVPVVPNKAVDDSKKPAKKIRRTQGELFLQLAGPLDEDHHSRKVSVKEFVGEYECLRFGNGASWARSDGALGKKYNIARYKEGKGNAITHIQIQGFQKNPKTRAISPRVKKAHENSRCVVFGHNTYPENYRP